MNFRTVATTGTTPSLWSMLLLLGSLLFASASRAGMGTEDAKHLLLRTGFSAPVAQVEKLAYGEFGRRPTENASTGTDHGTANVHFALGGKVKGGLHGKMPSLTNLENGNMIHSVDFRSVYATVLERHWNMNSRNILGQSYPAMGFIQR